MPIAANTSSIFDRHMSFLGTLTAWPSGFGSAASRLPMDDLRIFRRMSTRTRSIRRGHWHPSLSDAVAKASTVDFGDDAPVAQPVPTSPASDTTAMPDKRSELVVLLSPAVRRQPTLSAMFVATNVPVTVAGAPAIPAAVSRSYLHGSFASPRPPVLFRSVTTLTTESSASPFTLPPERVLATPATGTRSMARTAPLYDPLPSPALTHSGTTLRARSNVDEPPTPSSGPRMAFLSAPGPPLFAFALSRRRTEAISLMSAQMIADGPDQSDILAPLPNVSTGTARPSSWFAPTSTRSLFPFRLASSSASKAVSQIALRRHDASAAKDIQPEADSNNEFAIRAGNTMPQFYRGPILASGSMFIMLPPAAALDRRPAINSIWFRQSELRPTEAAAQMNRRARGTPSVAAISFQGGGPGRPAMQLIPPVNAHLMKAGSARAESRMPLRPARPEPTRKSAAALANPVRGSDRALPTSLQDARVASVEPESRARAVGLAIEWSGSIPTGIAVTGTMPIARQGQMAGYAAFRRASLVRVAASYSPTAEQMAKPGDIVSSAPARAATTSAPVTSPGALPLARSARSFPQWGADASTLSGSATRTPRTEMTSYDRSAIVPIVSSPLLAATIVAMRARHDMVLPDTSDAHSLLFTIPAQVAHGRRQATGTAVFASSSSESRFSNESNATGARATTSDAHGSAITVPWPRDFPLRLVARSVGAAGSLPHPSSVGRHRQTAMPLVVVDRAVSALSTSDDPPVAGMVPAPGHSASSRPDFNTSPPHSADHAGADHDEFGERVWREVMSRLAIERERRGFARWN